MVEAFFQQNKQSGNEFEQYNELTMPCSPRSVGFVWRNTKYQNTMRFNDVVAAASISSPTQGVQLYGSSRVESFPPDLFIFSVYHLYIVSSEYLCIFSVCHMSVCSEVGNEVLFPWAVPI